MTSSTANTRTHRRMTVDRCTICGRFVGWYPIGFYCDTHCRRCECSRCPSRREPPPRSYTLPAGMAQ